MFRALSAMHHHHSPVVVVFFVVVVHLPSVTSPLTYTHYIYAPPRLPAISKRAKDKCRVITSYYGYMLMMHHAHKTHPKKERTRYTHKK